MSAIKINTALNIQCSVFHCSVVPTYHMYSNCLLLVKLKVVSDCVSFSYEQKPQVEAKLHFFAAVKLKICIRCHCQGELSVFDVVCPSIPTYFCLAPGHAIIAFQSTDKNGGVENSVKDKESHQKGGEYS